MLSALLAAAAVVVVMAGIGLASSFVTLLAFSGLSVIVCRPLQLRLHRAGVPAWAALAATVGAYVLVLLALVVAGVASVAALAARLPSYVDPLQRLIAQVSETLGGVVGQGGITDLPGLDAGTIVRTASGLLSSTATVVTTLSISVLVVTYLLLDAPGLRARVLAVTSQDTLERFDRLAAELFTYVRVRAILGAGAAIVDTVLLLIVGVPFALLWGVVSFLFSFVPNVGFLLALVPPALIALLELGPVPMAAVVGGYVAINLAFDYVLQPRFMGAELDLSPVIVILAIIAWSAVLGPAGALLAVPLTIVLRALLLPYPGAAWFVAILGGPPEPRHVEEATEVLTEAEGGRP